MAITGRVPVGAGRGSLVGWEVDERIDRKLETMGAGQPWMNLYQENNATAARRREKKRSGTKRDVEGQAVSEMKPPSETGTCRFSSGQSVGSPRCLQSYVMILDGKGSRKGLLGGLSSVN